MGYLMIVTQQGASPLESSVSSFPLISTRPQLEMGAGKWGLRTIQCLFQIRTVP